MTAKKNVRAKTASRKKKQDNLFGLPKVFKQKIKQCAKEQGDESKPQVVFLWACVNEAGLTQGVKGERKAARPLTREEWLTVVDEAASLGANWLVLSFGADLSACGDFWGVCQWAQQAHNMMVGLHVKSEKLTQQDVRTMMDALDMEKTRILARKGVLDNVRLDEEEQKALVVWDANPQPDGERPNCQGPTRMIFVNARGVLYTCGLVEGNEAYRLGHVFDTKLKRIVMDPHLPHHVEDNLHYVTPECDGCPALIANYFFDNC